MVEGTYDIEAKTKLGTFTGQLVAIVTGEETFEADMTLGGKTAHAVGTYEGDTTHLEGELNLPFPFGKTTYVVDGVVDGDELRATVKNNKKMDFEITGTRVG